MVVKDVPALNEVQDYIYQKIDFSPTDLQKPILSSRKRFVLVAGGEQAGKSMVASKYLLGRFLEGEEEGLYWLVAADYERTRAEFEYLVQDFSTLGLLKEATKRVDPGRIVLADGTRIETKSAKDPRTLAMRAPNGIIGCEASQLDLETLRCFRHGNTPPRKTNNRSHCPAILISIFTQEAGKTLKFWHWRRQAQMISLWRESKESHHHHREWCLRKSERISIFRM